MLLNEVCFFGCIGEKVFLLQLKKVFQVSVNFRMVGQFELFFIYGVDKSRERIFCDNLVGYFKRREIKVGFVEVGVKLGFVSFKKWEGCWKVYLEVQFFEFFLCIFSYMIVKFFIYVSCFLWFRICFMMLLGSQIYNICLIIILRYLIKRLFRLE